MKYITEDAKAWLAQQPKQMQTHSENCHQWHPACLVSRLLAGIDRLNSEKAADWKACCESARLASDEIHSLRQEKSAWKLLSNPPAYQQDVFVSDSSGFAYPAIANVFGSDTTFIYFPYATPGEGYTPAYWMPRPRMPDATHSMDPAV